MTPIDAPETSVRAVATAQALGNGQDFDTHYTTKCNTTRKSSSAVVNRGYYVILSAIVEVHAAINNILL